MPDLNSTRLVEGLEQLDPAARQYILNNLPAHLDAVGDAAAAARLLDLALSGFPQLKAERVLDLSQSQLDYRYYFRATLRACSLEAALKLATPRAGLMSLANWLASGVLADLMSHVGPGTRLWEQIQRAIGAIEDISIRVERLAAMHRPDLDPVIYAWLRRQFDSVTAPPSASASMTFLTAVATHERGAIGYVLDRASTIEPSAGFVTTVIENVQRLCEGTPETMESALARLVLMCRGHAERQVDVAEALAKRPRREAEAGLLALETLQPEAGENPEALQVAATLACAWWDCGWPDRAEAQARRCLTLGPPPPKDETFRLLYARSSVDTAARVLRAAGPFESLWDSARGLAEDLASRGTWLIHRAEALAGYLRAVPRMANPQARLDWLQRTLEEINTFSASDLDVEGFDVLVTALKSKSSSRRHLRLAPIEAAVFEVLGHIDQVLASADALDPMIDLFSCAVDLANPDDTKPTLVEKLLRAASRSHNIRIRISMPTAILQASEGDESTLAAICAALPDLMRGVDHDTARMLANGLLESVERDRVDTVRKRQVLAHGAFSALIESRDRALFEAVAPRVMGWLESSADQHDSLLIGWAAALIALGDAENGRRLLATLRPEARSLRLLCATTLLKAQAPDLAADMIQNDLPAHIDLDDDDERYEVLSIARTLLLARRDASTRDLLLAAAFDYRRLVGQIATDAEADLLNAFADLDDAQIVSALLQSAEAELLRSGASDAVMAANWYVALALSAIGQTRGARQAWARTYHWSQSAYLDTARRAAVAVLASPHATDAVRNLLEALDLLEHERESARLRRSVCQMVARTEGAAKVELIDGLLHLSSKFDDLIPDLCAALKEVEVDHALAQRIAALTSKDQLRALFDLLEARSLRLEPQDLDHLLRGVDDAELWARGLKLRTHLDEILTVIAPVQVGVRCEFLQAVIDDAAVRADSATMDLALDALLGASATECGPVLPIALAHAFNRARTVATPARLVQLKACIHDLGAPQPTGARVEWARSLHGTSLSALANAEIQWLGQHLDTFATTPRDLQSLPEYLLLAAPTDPDALFAFYAQVSAWAMRMPPVTNEDWRHVAFGHVLRATGDIPAPLRTPIQRRSVACAFEGLASDGYARREFAKSLIGLPLDPPAADDAVSLWLSDLSREGRVSDAALEMLVESTRYGAEKATPAVIDAFLERVTAEPPARLNREAAASAAFATSYEPLRARLSALLLDDFARQGLANLEAAELNFLTIMPLEWWIEHSTRLGVRSTSEYVLREWIEHLTRRMPDAAWWGVALATEWLGPSGPSTVDQFWFDLCLLPEWFPEMTRTTIIRQLTRH